MSRRALRIPKAEVTERRDSMIGGAGRMTSLERRLYLQRILYLRPSANALRLACALLEILWDFRSGAVSRDELCSRAQLHGRSFGPARDELLGLRLIACQCGTRGRGKCGSYELLTGQRAQCDLA